MISKKTVLILGAGASWPYGFPLASDMTEPLCGHALSYRIEQSDNRSEGIKIPLHPSFGNEDHVMKFREDLHRSSFYSIDSFLTARPEYAEIGKAAIAATLVPLESLANLDGAHRRANPWYKYLRNQMGDSPDEFASSAKNLSIVTFNYDRSFEYFFFRALTASYGESRALDILKDMKIVHVYGQLGKPHFLDAKGRPYSPKLDRDVVAKCVAEIKVIPENKDGSLEFDEASRIINDAEKVCFLGFGYNQTNTTRLKLKKVEYGVRPIFCSAYGLKTQERARAATLIPTEEPALKFFGKEDEDSLLFLKTYAVFE